MQPTEHRRQCIDQIPNRNGYHQGQQECLTDEEIAGLHLDDPEYIESLDFWQLQPRLDKYIETWNAVKAAN